MHIVGDGRVSGEETGGFACAWDILAEQCNFHVEGVAEGLGRSLDGVIVLFFPYGA